ncbi:MAG: hypothetical protein WBF77_12060 [Sulfurimonadaceae bacterium]
MKKLLALVVAALVLSFSGCSSKEATASEGVATKPAEEKVSTYLVGAYVDADAAQAKLTEAGFEVVAAYKVDKKGEYTSIVFTNAAMKSAANKADRGFAAVLRLLVNNEKQEISITNPVYFGKAFMQDDFDYQAALAVEKSLSGVFGELKGSADKWAFDGLAGYHFMMGMPYYEESAVLAEGDNAELLEKAKAYKKGKNLIFELQLGEGRTLLGYELGARTSKFVKKIGYQNAQILPYTVLIEDGKAKMLAAKYYIAISYPQLTMGEFMTIASVPGAIEKDLAKPFK